MCCNQIAFGNSAELLIPLMFHIQKNAVREHHFLCQAVVRRLARKLARPMKPHEGSYGWFPPRGRSDVYSQSAGRPDTIWDRNGICGDDHGQHHLSGLRIAPVAMVNIFARK